MNVKGFFHHYLIIGIFAVSPVFSSQLMPVEKTDFSCIITGKNYHQDSLINYGYTSETQLQPKRSAYYEIYVSECIISLSDTASSSDYIVADTGYFSVDTVSLSPSDTVEWLEIGDTLEVFGYTLTGDEFGQKYLYDSLSIKKCTGIKTEAYEYNYRMDEIKSVQINQNFLGHNMNKSIDYSINGRMVSGYITREIQSKLILISIPHK